MKKLIIASSLALATAFSGSLLAGTSGDAYHQRHLERMSERLDLTPEQQREVGELHREQFEKHKALREETTSRMNEILTEEQREKLEQLRKERSEKMKQHHGKRGEDRRNG